MTTAHPRFSPARPGRRGVSRWRAAFSALLAILLLGTLAACSSIPVAGPVGTLPPRAVAQDDEASPLTAQGPQPGDDAASIVLGFLVAGRDSGDNYDVARTFLTPELAQSWNATERTLVLSQLPTPAPASGDTHWRANAAVVRTIDANGVRSDLASPRSQTLSFTLTKVDGEWRIAAAPEGIVVEESTFDRLFTPVTLYFYADATATVAVPDVRWIARRKGRPTSVVSALMAGPAPYLQGAVVSAFPEGSTLSRQSVPVEDGVATVDLPPALASKLNDQQRRLMAQQLLLSLRGVASITSVQLSAQDTVLDIGTPEQQPAEPVINPQVDGVLVGIKDGRVVTVSNGSATPIPGADKLPQHVHSPALAVSGNGVAVLSPQRDELLAVGEGGKVSSLAKGTRLMAPSYDAKAWVFSGEQAKGKGLIVARASGGKKGELNAPWLSDVTLSGVRVSIDGTRVALVGEQDGKPVAFVAGIVRDGAGKPNALGSPLRLNPGFDAARVLFASDDSLVLYEPSAKDMLQVVDANLDGSVTPWRQKLRGVTHLAVASGAEHAVLGETADGLYVRKTATWDASDLKLSEVSYRG